MSHLQKTVKEKAKWTLSKERYLIERLIEQENLGKRVGTVWSKDGWRAVLESFNRHFNVQFDYTQLKNRLGVLRKKYFIVRDLRNHSGFVWDDVTHTITAVDDVWDHYIMAHPEASNFRKHAFPLYESLHTIFEGKRANDTGKRIAINLETQDKKVSSVENTQYPIVGGIQLYASETNMESSNSSSERETSGQNSRGSKQQVVTPTTSSRNKRVRSGAKDKENDSLRIIAASAAEMIKLKEKKYSSQKHILGDCVEELQNMEGLSMDEIIQAIELLKDEKEAIIFMRLREPVRSYWLRSKINRQNQ